MHVLRAMILRRRRLAIVALALALCFKLVLPAGTMIAGSSLHTLTVTICADSTGDTRTITLTVPGKHGADEAPGARHDVPCAFTGMAAPALGGADIVLLAMAFAFIVLLGLAPARRLPPAASGYLRPPLRGPPAFA